MNEICFVILFRSEAGERLARTVIESLREFGGRLRDSQVWVFIPDPERVGAALPGMEGVERFPLVVERDFPAYPFAEKVHACAQAEAMAGLDTRFLVWLSLDSLIVNPPRLFDLGPASGAAPAEAALRPVHHRNIGSPADESPDGYWGEIYRRLGVAEMTHTVESFLDGEKLRPYFNTHNFAFNPSAGLCQAWRGYFEDMVCDRYFQDGPCRDELHKIFLHQAILSTLLVEMLPWDRVRLLPPEYSYPLHMLKEMKPHLRVAKLNDLVTAVYEDEFPWGQVEIQEPLRSWLRARVPTGE